MWTTLPASTFPFAFRCLKFDSNFTEHYSQASNHQQVRICSNNGLAPRRRHGNIWIYDGLCSLVHIWGCINTLRPRQNGRHFADDTFKRIFMNENVRISINISLKFVPKGLINNIPALVQIMAWRRPGVRPLSEPMMVNSLTHICLFSAPMS